MDNEVQDHIRYRSPNLVESGTVSLQIVMNFSMYKNPEYQVSRGWPETAEEQAEAGDVEAQLYMAFRCFTNPDPKQQKQSLHWYELAANQGTVEAMVNLCRIHERGLADIGVSADLEEACRWMKQIVASGEESVRARSIIQAYGWYLLGAKTSAGESDSYKEEQQKLPDDQLDAEEGLRCLELAGNQGDVTAAVRLANLYTTGQHPKVKSDVVQGMDWFKKGAHLGDSHSAFKLAKIYQSGLVPANQTLHDKWLEVAARMGDPDAKDTLATIMFGSETELPLPLVRRRLRQLETDETIRAYLAADEIKKCSNPACSNEEDEANGKLFNRCSRCKSAKYCSKECQETQWHAGHKEICKKLKKSHDELQSMNRNALIHMGHLCSLPECQKKGETVENGLQRCARCKVTSYCSKDCQVKHWKSGHSVDCKKTVAELEGADHLLKKIDTIVALSKQNKE